MQKAIRKERIVCISVLAGSSALLLIERATPVEINNNFLLFFLVFAQLGSVSIMVSHYLFGELPPKYLLLLLLIVWAICTALAVLTWSNNWKTQIILYRNPECAAETIEYRMRDCKFGYGFEKQIVQRKRLLPFINEVKSADTATIDLSKWIRVNENVNEMKFPGEYVQLPN